MLEHAAHRACVPASGVQCRWLRFRLLTLHFPAASLSPGRVHRSDPVRESPALVSDDGEAPVPRVSLGAPHRCSAEPTERPGLRAESAVNPAL